MESKNVVFIETQLRPLPTQSKESRMQVCRDEQVGNNKGHNNFIYDNFFCDIRDNTSVVELLSGLSADHVTAGGYSKNL